MSKDVITIGCDPEFFVLKEVSKVPVFEPICGYLGGTKEKPKRIKGLPKGYCVQEDGSAAEFNIPPQTSADSFSDAIQAVLDKLTEQLKEKGLTPSKNLRFTYLSGEAFEKFPHLRVVGCDPDFDAYRFDGETEGYRGMQRPMPTIGAGRGVGGHIHIGYDKTKCPEDILAMLLDCCLAFPMIPLDRQGGRRNYYGRPGLYREKPYGMEYRTLSNFWIWTPELRKMVFNVCHGLVSSIYKDPDQWYKLYKWLTKNYGMHEIQYSILEETSAYRKGCYKQLISKFQEFAALDKIILDSGVVKSTTT